MFLKYIINTYFGFKKNDIDNISILRNWKFWFYFYILLPINNIKSRTIAYIMKYTYFINNKIVLKKNLIRFISYLYKS
ncbi:hypothetical protein PFTANZ_05611 [Plasmodium falciparum Tanzania (2000708)]|uniref:Uncharacterized protein n=2 Tax=Plasmodium falciparum TaxID=5833 RepID=A0A024VY69_PLAFA|nr:hypothetical protein PFFVO_05266 [Plasmodium falciparum Vietnam Oak-Knoll (FVO)]ETW33644.1 hypothetical protein PFTANZ_05611 [Plasmodium falciparum Tanzania (2000708)]